MAAISVMKAARQLSHLLSSLRSVSHSIMAVRIVGAYQLRIDRRLHHIARPLHSALEGLPITLGQRPTRRAKGSGSGRRGMEGIDALLLCQ